MSRAITKGVICMADVSVDIGVKIDEGGIKKSLASMGKMIASEIGEVVKIIGSLGVHAVKTGDESSAPESSGRPKCFGGWKF